MDDRTIVNLILAGDPAGLNRLLARHGHALAEYARALTGDNDALFESVYEDVLVDILRALRGYSSRAASLRRFLFESAARTVRRRFPRLLTAAGAPRSAGNLPLREMSRVSTAGKHELAAAMSGLAPAERELLVLRYRLGFSYSDISDIIKEARVSLEDRLLAARGHFRSRLLTGASS